MVGFAFPALKRWANDPCTYGAGDGLRQVNGLRPADGLRVVDGWCVVDGLVRHGAILSVQAPLRNSPKLSFWTDSESPNPKPPALPEDIDSCLD